MAKLPVPVGIDRMMRDFAESIGDGARLLPERSRSAVGAVAMKRATVEIDFEMTAGSSRRDGSVGIGVRGFLIGAGVRSGRDESFAAHRGRIVLEIVAIADTAETSDVGPTRPDPEPSPQPAPPDSAAVAAAIAQMEKLLQTAEAARAIEPRAAVQAHKLLESATKALADGDVAGAVERLDAAAALIEPDR